MSRRLGEGGEIVSPKTRIEWCGNIQVHIPIKPRKS